MRRALNKRTSESTLNERSPTLNERTSTLNERSPTLNERTSTLIESHFDAEHAVERTHSRTLVNERSNTFQRGVERAQGRPTLNELSMTLNAALNERNER